MTIETELQKLTKVKPKTKEDRQDYLARLIEAVQDLKDDVWDTLTKPSAEWTNAGATAIQKNKTIKDFPDAEEEVEEEPAPRRGKPRAAEEEEVEEEPAPRRGKPRAEREEEVEEEVEEEPAPRRSRSGGRGGVVEEEVEEEPAPRRSSRRAEPEEEVEEEPAPRRSTRRAAVEEEVEDEPAPRRGTRRAAAEEEPEPETEEEEVASSKKGGGKTPAKKPAAKPAVKAKGDKKPGAQTMIKKLVIGKPSMDTEAIMAKLKAAGVSATISAISTIKSGTLQTMRLIQAAGGLPKGEF